MDLIELENKQQILYKKLQSSNNKEETENIRDEIILNSRLINDLLKRQDKK
jgi:hypothetical protein